jgi:hypothetical protein
MSEAATEKPSTPVAEPVQEVHPALALAAQQEQAEADAAQLQHLRQRVPVLRAQLNIALERCAELERQLLLAKPQDRKPPRRPTPKTTAAKTTAAKKTTRKS